MVNALPPAPPAGQNIDAAKAHQTAKEFESVFLTQFVDEMMKTTGDTAFGGPDQAEMWRSFMSEAVANHLVEQGGLGLTGSVEKMLNAYTQPTKTEATP
ncbi:Rod binding protein [Sulfitobacter brevis]|uniref:Rod binding protein n=1 Tax=Sulfitobacter brevis TaxID=74348 RepID=A0A1I2DZC1_9RHOB|nr:rod-binding protein [Sulfitobacter brevis]SFE85975.1 Rod binding protein [Sulfitobacter brevis]